MKNKIYLMTIFCILTGYCCNMLKAQTGPGGVSGASLWLRADAGINSSSVTYFNVPASNRTASSTYNDASLAPSYSTLSSSSGWAASSPATGQYLTLDLGSTQTVYGVVTKGRQGSYAQWVKKYTVSYSNDNVTYTPLGITFPGNADQNTEATNIFPSAITARYVRITETDYNGHPSMRVDLIKNVNPFSTADSSVHLWQDQSSNGMNFMRRGATAPVYQNSGAAGTNFNPVIQFNGSNYFENYVNVPSANNTNYTKFAVFNTTGTTGNIISAADPGNSAFYLSGGSLYLYHNENLSNPVSVSNNVPIIGTGVWSNGTANGTYLRTNGKSGTAFNSNKAYTTGGLQIGAFQSGTNIPASSTIAESIVFSSALSPAQINKVESYLAMKYGVTLDPQNYVASDGTIIWNSGTNSSYNNNIAGIGWDYDSGLNQKQSQSVNGGFQPVIGNGNIATTNTGNSNSFNEDGTFMVWGSDTGSTNFSTAFSYSGLNYRMPRIWKVQKTKTLGMVKVAVPVSFWPGALTQPALLVSSTTAFDGTSIKPMTQEAIGGISYYTVTLDPSSVQYFSFAGFVTAPGGVISGLNLWLKAGLGVGATNSSVDTWKNAINTSTTYTTSGTKPDLLDSGANFNPAVNFPGNQGGISTPDLTYSDWTVYFTLNGQDNGNASGLIGGNNFGLNYETWQNTNRLGVIVSSAGTLPNTGDYASTLSKPDGQLGLLKFQHSSSSNNVIITSISNGVSTTATLNTNNSNRPISIQLLASGYKGTLSEMILLGNATLTATEEAKVYTYMALKYGATLGTDYILADGTTNVWSVAGNTGYSNNIAGIGRDDASALNQKQSQSANSGIQPVIGNLNIADTNANNSNGFAADKTFMVWGSDTGSTNFATSFAFGGLNNRMARTWKVQKTGTIGTVKVAIPVSMLPGSVTKLALLSGSTTTFDGTSVKMMVQENISGVNYYTVTVDFSSVQFFSFAALVTAPGGVTSSLQTWMKADNGVTVSSGAVSNWADATGNGNNFSEPTNRPLYNSASNLVNFNPSISFNGSNQQLTNSTFVINQSAASVFAIAKFDNISSAWQTITASGNGQGTIFRLAGNNLHYKRWIDNSNTTTTTGSKVFQSNNPYLLGLTTATGSNNEKIYIDGTLDVAGTTSVIPSASTFTFIGVKYVQAQGDYFGGSLPEIIYYSGSLSAADRMKVESYLALKYGTTKFGDYTASDATTYWNSTSNSGYQNNIAGIGRDDASALNQKQSQSVNSDIQPVIGNVDIADTNANNSNVFTADKSFLVWGSDTGSTSFATPFAYGTSNFRMTRIWKVQKTGTIGKIKVAIPVAQLPLTVSQPSLLISTDATFDGNDARKSMTSVSIGGIQYYIAEVDTTVDGFTSGSFFSFSAFVTAPGGVIAGLKIWHKADTGVTSASGLVTAWNNQVDGRQVTNSGGSYRPTLVTGGDSFNFNPYLSFTSTSNALYDSGATPFVTDGNMTSLMSAIVSSGTQIWGVNQTPSYTTDPYDDFQWFTGSVYQRGNLISSFTTLADNVPSVVTFTQDGAANKINGYRNLSKIVDNVTNSYSLGSGGYLFGNDGIASGNDVGIVGKISEFIAYNNVLSAVDLQKVQSYLAVKTGNTFNQNHLASNGSTLFWDASANSVYGNNIAGIGRDDASALLQKQSQSVNTGYQLIAGLSTVAATNAANAGTLNNLQFLMWGDNNAANTAPFTAISGYNSRLNRVWKVQNTNTVNQSVQVLVPVTTSTVAGLVPATSSLLCGTDATFAGSYQVYNPAGTVTVNSVSYLSFNVPASMVNKPSFYMTLAFYEQSPGGVRGEALWLRGDAGLAGVKSWLDQSGNNKNLRWDINDCQNRQSTGQMVLGKTLNFNPVASFGDNNNWTWAFTQVNTSRTSFPNADVAIIYKSNSAGTYDVWGTDYGGGFDERSLTTTQIANDNTGLSYSGGNSGFATINVASFQGIVNSGSNVVVNGNTTLNFTGNTRYQGCPEIRLGDVAGAGTPFNGLIGEFVVYQKNMSAVERIQLNSYLAMKYGITLGRNNDGDGTPGEQISASPSVYEGDYLASDGTTKIWSSDAVYQNNVVAIGRDDISAFHQRITMSQSATPDIITLSTDSNFTNVNQSGASGHTDIASDKYFFVTGNNNGALTYTVKSGLSNDLNALMNRIWKVKQSGTLQDVYVKTSNTKATYLVYSADATFSTGVTYVPLSGGATVSGTQIPSGNYFTFATFLEAPGGVLSTLWLRASDNFTAGSWTDYNGNGFQFTQGDPYYRPTYAGNSMNFNPTAYFNGNNFMSMTTYNGFLNNDMRNPHSFATALRTSVDNSTIFNFEGTQTITRQGDWDYLDNGGYSIDDQCRCSQPIYGGAGLTDFNYSMIGTLTFSGGLSATSGSIKYYRDGKRLSTASIDPSSQAYGLTANTRLGYRYGGIGGFLNGYLAEQVVFAKSLSDLDITAVNSYMALKYGNTLSRDQDGDGTFAETVSGSVIEGDYIASDHTTRVWNSDPVYQNNIIGLAKDKTSTLHQRISRSQMPSTDIITLSTDNNFTNANQSGSAGHTDIASDMYFFITGHNGKPATFTLKSGLSNSLNAIMNRVWKVQQTGTAQNIFIKVDNARATYLIYSSDPTFSSGVTYKMLTTGVTPGVQIPSGNYFTFAAPLNGPGGVTDNLVRWYRADRDVVTGSTLTWKDQTVNADATQTSTGDQPVYNTSGTSLLNFNPSFTFDGQSDYLSFSDTRMASGSSSRSVFGVGRTSVTGGTFEWLSSYGTSASAQNFGLERSGNNVLVTTYGNDFYPYNTNNPYASNTLVISYGAAAGGTLYGTYNALPIQSGSYTVNTVLNTGRIGTRQSLGEYWNGVIGEVVHYNKIPTPAEKAKVDSYLALKYGVSLGSSSNAFVYVGSDGSAFWSGTDLGVSTYQNNIAAIGRDDISDLNQKQSQSVNAGRQVIIGLGNMAATNEANTGSFDNNLQFLAWGDNNTDMVGNTSAFTAVYPYQERLSRVWRVQNTNSLSKDIQLLIPATYIKDLKVSSLLYSTDASFATGSQIISSTATGVVTVNSVDYKAFTIPAAQVNQPVFYFTMAYYKKSPGGVVGENLWLRADDGVSATTDNTPVAQWNDQSANNSHGTQATTAKQPVFKNNATDNINFNPVLAFNATNAQNFDIAGNLGIGGQKGVAVFGVSDTSSGARYFLEPKTTGTNLLEFRSDAAGSALLKSSGSTSVTGSLTGFGAAALYSGWTTSAATGNMFGGVNGNQSAAATLATNWTAGSLSLGAAYNQTAFTTGKIPEVAEYSKVLTATELQKVNSYLALKYGITMDQTTIQDYLASDGNKSWTKDATYKYNIAGIGRDDLTALNQKQSQSVNADSQMLVALGSAAAGNTANTNTFSADMQYLVWGDDNGSLTTKVATGNVAANGLTYTKRFSRVWKTQNKGSLASDIRVYFPVSAFGNVWPSSVGLIYASTAAKLSDGTAAVIMNNGTQTINGVNYYMFPVEASTVSSLNYLSFTTATSVCYKPAVTAGTALSTKAGITTLGRAGVNADNWPMVRKGGWIALEAQTKGMIINRVRFKDFGPTGSPNFKPVDDTETNLILTNPQEGMIVMDISNRMLKVYTTKNGTPGWYQIGQQTCPD